MKPRHVIIPVTFIVTLMLMTQIVYAAHVMGNSHHILLYNIDSVNGLTGDPVEDEEPEKYFDTLIRSLESEDFTVDYVSRKQVPSIDNNLLNQYSQVWILETDADKDRRHEYDFNEVELDNILSYVRDGKGSLLLAAEEDFSHFSVMDEGSILDGALGILGAWLLWGLSVGFAFITAGLGAPVSAVGIALSVQLFSNSIDKFRSNSWHGDRNLYSRESTEELLSKIDYGDEASFTNHINQVSVMFGILFLGLTEKYNCKTSTRDNIYLGSALARNSIPEPQTRNQGNYGPFCVQGNINGVGGRNPPDKCPCIQVEPQPVAESLINKSHPVFDNVNTVYIDGREPLILPFRADIVPLKIGISQRVQFIDSDQESHHTFAMTIPHVIDQTGVTGKVYFESSWTRFTNNYPTESQNNIAQGDTIQYAINIANWLEPSPDLSEGSCVNSDGIWKNADGNVATTNDNCCAGDKIGIIIDGGKFACIEI